MVTIKKILIWCFIICEMVILPWGKRFDTSFLFYVQIFAELCLSLSLLIMIADFLVSAKAYPKKFITWLFIFFGFMILQNIVLGPNFLETILGARSYFKFPLFFLVLVSTFSLANEYRVLLVFFRIFLIISLPLSLFQFYILKWHHDWCGGILPSGEFALFGTFMFILELSLLAITKRKRHFFALLGIVVILLTAETKLPFFLIAFGVFILLCLTRWKRLIGLAVVAIALLISGVMVSQSVVAQSRLKEYFFSPQRAIYYLTVNKLTGKTEILDNQEYRHLARKYDNFRLNRIPGLVFAWRELHHSVSNIIFGLGIGISTPTKVGSEDNLYVNLGVSNTQLAKGLLEIGVFGMMLYIALILSQINFTWLGIYNRFNYPVDQAVVVILLPVLFCYLSAMLYNQVFMSRAGSIFFWTIIAYNKKLKEGP